MRKINFLYINEEFTPFLLVVLYFFSGSDLIIESRLDKINHLIQVLHMFSAIQCKIYLEKQ